MNPELCKLIETYRAAVSRSLKLLEDAGVKLPGSAQEWVLDGPRRGELGSDARFQKHGIGCTVYEGSVATDFDFGPSGETDAFDGWRLFRFAADHCIASSFKTYRDIDAHLIEAEKAGEVAQLRNSKLYRLRVR